MMQLLPFPLLCPPAVAPSPPPLTHSLPACLFLHSAPPTPAQPEGRLHQDRDWTSLSPADPQGLEECLEQRRCSAHVCHVNKGTSGQEWEAALESQGPTPHGLLATTGLVAGRGLDGGLPGADGPCPTSPPGPWEGAGTASASLWAGHEAPWWEPRGPFAAVSQPGGQDTAAQPGALSSLAFTPPGPALQERAPSCGTPRAPCDPGALQDPHPPCLRPLWTLPTQWLLPERALRQARSRQRAGCVGGREQARCCPAAHPQTPKAAPCPTQGRFLPGPARALGLMLAPPSEYLTVPLHTVPRPPSPP